MSDSSFEKIACGEVVLAIIIRADFRKDGIAFFTPNDFSQQLAYMNRPTGHSITPHVHNKVQREVFFTQEVLFVRSGRMQVDLYDEQREYVCSRELQGGDVILLAGGGHGFKMLEPTEMIEVKQGPYSGGLDKTRFDPISKADC